MLQLRGVEERVLRRGGVVPTHANQCALVVVLPVCPSVVVPSTMFGTTFGAMSKFLTIVVDVDSLDLCAAYL